MATPGWYPEPGRPGELRWWDGSTWTDHRMPATAPPPPAVASGAVFGAPPAPPAAMPKLRPDGTLRGPSRRASLAVLLAGIALLVVVASVVVPGFLDAVDGPRISVPGERSVDLEEGTWVLYQHTGTSSGGGGFTFDMNRGVTLHPDQVTVTGPADVTLRGRGSTTETITWGDRTYTDAVRFVAPVAGRYRIELRGEPASEVLVARPAFHSFRMWPWLLVGLVASSLVIGGMVMWLIGASNRRIARKAGIAP